MIIGIKTNSTNTSGAIFQSAVNTTNSSKLRSLRRENIPTIVVMSSDDEMAIQNNMVPRKSGGATKQRQGSSKREKVQLTNVGQVRHPKDVSSAIPNTGLVKTKSAERLTEETSTRREERGSSFCDILSSSKMTSSRGASKSSLILEDDGSSSDAGASCSDDFSNGGSRGVANRSSSDDHDDDDHDLEQKIRFFFQRIEQQESVGSTVEADTTKLSATISDQDTRSLHQLNDSFEVGYSLSKQSSNDSVANTSVTSDNKDESMIGKRKMNGLNKLAVDLDRHLKIHSNLSTLSSTSKRSKLSSEDGASLSFGLTSESSEI